MSILSAGTTDRHCHVWIFNVAVGDLNSGPMQKQQALYPPRQPLFPKVFLLLSHKLDFLVVPAALRPTPQGDAHRALFRSHVTQFFYAITPPWLDSHLPICF